MGTTLTELERRILAVLQKGFPLSRTPYRDMAAEIGIESGQLLDILREWKNNGRLRRIGAIVSHVKVGYQAGSMVVWKVPAERIEEVGRQLAGFSQVTHAYQRPSSDNWPYNIYTMVHGATEEEVTQTVEQMSEACGIKDYSQLRTLRELKKVPPTYIIEDRT